MEFGPENRWKSGNVAMTFALLLPLLLGAVGAGVDFARYSSIQAGLQESVDAAALAGAREYLTSKAAAKIAESRALHAANAAFQVNTGLERAVAEASANDNEASVTVAATASYRPSLFVALFKTPIEVVADATAQTSGGANICVITLGESGGDVFKMTARAQLDGDNCAVYSNSTDPAGMSVRDNAFLKSAFTCSSGGYRDTDRHFDPIPLTDCPKREDPLAERAEPYVGVCNHNDLVLKDYVGRISPGVYCGGLVVDGASSVQLDPGMYFFKDGALAVKSTSRFSGDDVGLFFTGKDAGIRFEDKSAISLAAPESGAMAGVLIWQSKSASGIDKFEIFSNKVDRLVGTIYLPDSDFIVSATDEVAEDSAYTAIIAKRIALEKNATLVLNTDYNLTPVPTPPGIANAGGSVYLRE